MLAVFDNDGTICDTQGADDACYAQAIEAVTGLSLKTLDWTAYEEPTSSAIVRKLLAGDPLAAEKERAVETEYVRLLEAAQPDFPGDFRPIPGAVEFMHRLVGEGVCPVAIATGCFAQTARFKLKCCGVSLDAYPHATASDQPRRKDIIPLAASRAGHATSAIVYFGDATWDVRVSRTLGIPMIGIGRKIDRLRGFGVRHVFRDYSDPDAIIRALRSLVKKPA